MSDQEFYKILHRKIAQSTVGASALRNQGAGGLINICRNYFENNIQLDELFSLITHEIKFKYYLDKHTDLIVYQFPTEAKSWGGARKAINLFFREIVYNSYFAVRYSIPIDFKSNNEYLKNLEVPLDSYVVEGLRNEKGSELPVWNGIKYLNKIESDIFQEKAKVIADNKGIARIHLDIEYWRKKWNDNH